MNFDEAKQVAEVFSNYFDNFGNISDYMRDQKINSLDKNYSATLPGMGPEDDLFDSFDMHPNDMKFKVHSLPIGIWSNYLDIISTHVNQHSVPGRNIFLGVKETTTDKWVGFIRLGSPVINCKPRNVLLESVFTQSENGASAFNKSAMMGFVIVPAQPFGFNYLGGKLLAGLCCSHEVREMVNKKYDMNLCLFETTSLYGSSKSASQYDGMKPFLRYKGLTDSDFLPLMHGKPYEDLKKFIEKIEGGTIIEQGASSYKLKFSNKVVSMTKVALKGTPEGEKFTKTIEHAKSLTEQKRYYISNYGIQNFVDIVTGKADKIIEGETFYRHHQDHIIEWWKNKATTRYESLKADGRLRTEIEVWTNNQDIDIIR